MSDIQRKVTFNPHSTDLGLLSSASITEGPTLMQAQIGFGVAGEGEYRHLALEEYSNVARGC